MAESALRLTPSMSQADLDPLWAREDIHTYPSDLSRAAASELQVKSSQVKCMLKKLTFLGARVVYDRAGSRWGPGRPTPHLVNRCVESLQRRASRRRRGQLSSRHAGRTTHASTRSAREASRRCTSAG